MASNSSFKLPSSMRLQSSHEFAPINLSRVLTPFYNDDDVSAPTPASLFNSYLIARLKSQTLLEDADVNEEEHNTGPFVFAREVDGDELEAVFARARGRAQKAQTQLEDPARVRSGSARVLFVEDSLSLPTERPAIPELSILNLIAQGIQSIELEQEIKQRDSWIERQDLPDKQKNVMIQLNYLVFEVFAYKGTHPDGTVRWFIHVCVFPRDYKYTSIRAKGVSREDYKKRENRLAADHWLVFQSSADEGRTEDDFRAFEQLFTWEVCVELLKHHIQVSSGKEEKKIQPLEHMGITGWGFGMEKEDIDQAQAETPADVPAMVAAWKAKYNGRGDGEDSKLHVAKVKATLNQRGDKLKYNHRGRVADIILEAIEDNQYSMEHVVASKHPDGTPKSRKELMGDIKLLRNKTKGSSDADPKYVWSKPRWALAEWVNERNPAPQRAGRKEIIKLEI